MKAIYLRVDDDFHKELKHLSVDLNKSLNQYFIELAKKDIEERKKEQ